MGKSVGQMHLKTDALLTASGRLAAVKVSAGARGGARDTAAPRAAVPGAACAAGHALSARRARRGGRARG